MSHRPRLSAIRGLLAALLALAVTTAALLGARDPSRAGAAGAVAHPSRIVVAHAQWFSSGANMPWVHEGCDFASAACVANRDVLATEPKISRAFQTLDRSEIRTVRWYAFPGAALQIERTAAGAPERLNPAVYPDFDAAIQLAKQYDLHYDFVLLSGGGALPAAWFTDPVQREALVDVLAPLFARYGHDSQVLSWELVDEPERLTDPGTVDVASMRATIQALAAAVHQHGTALATIGPITVDRASQWTGLGLDFYAPHWFSTANPSGPSCALCTTAAALQQGGVDEPVVLGAVDTAPTQAAGRYAAAYAAGYAGLWAWSLFPAQVPQYTLETGVDYAAAQALAYAHPDVGPRLRPLNPCTGPHGGEYRCPDLRMSAPSSLTLTRSRGHELLESTSSLDNLGTGPAEIDAHRTGRFTMSGSQRLYHAGAHGSSRILATDASLFFKPIPGQYRYWKWVDAARFELWRLSPTGQPVQLVKESPKQIYCLRDLKHTRPGLPGSPGSAVYPGCSQKLPIRTDRLGLNPGWSDVYPSTYFQNWIDVTGLRGCFAYIHIADPENHIMESDEFDNRAATTVRLPFTGSAKGCPGTTATQLIADPTVRY